jgi:DNA-binding NarL/FixJ family response regulator
VKYWLSPPVLADGVKCLLAEVDRSARARRSFCAGSNRPEEGDVRTRILLADPELMVREGLRRILELHEGFEVVGEVADGADAVLQIQALQPDVAILEFTLPGISGVEVIRSVAGRGPTRCLIVSRGHTRTQVQEALRAGAAGYLLKSEPASQLVGALEEIRQGKYYFSPDVSQHIVEAATSGQGIVRNDLGRLTAREHEVLHLVAQGLSNKEIAESLGMSTRTAESHRGRLMNKLGIHKVSGLVRLAIREGLLDA